jgi:hypothetical protein
MGKERDVAHGQQAWVALEEAVTRLKPAVVALKEGAAKGAGRPAKADKSCRFTDTSTQ